MLTEPEFSTEISKSSLIVRPVAPEIHTAVLTSLKHLLIVPCRVTNKYSTLESFLTTMNGNSEYHV